MPRVLGIDFGRRRVGLAISDASGTLARPLTTLTVKDFDEALARITDQIARLGEEEGGLDAVVVGSPSHLDGSPSEESRRVAAFVAELARRIRLPVVTVDERLTSHEADRRLAERERDWRVRKARLDAAAAAIILQDYLDRPRRD